jgi:hypothetical protein
VILFNDIVEIFHLADADRHGLSSSILTWLRRKIIAQGPSNENCDKAAHRGVLAATIGADGRRLLLAVKAATDRPWLQQVPAVQTLRQVWAEQYTDPPRYPPAVYRDLVLDSSNANDLHRKGYAAKRAS